MDEGELRRLCRATVDELGLRPPLQVRQLCERLGAARSRPIVLEARADRIHLIRGNAGPDAAGGTLMCGALHSDLDRAAHPGQSLYDDWKEW